MPLLRKLLRVEDLGNVPANSTAEQLFASNIDMQEMRSQRQQAAALCSAPLHVMSTLARRQRSRSALDTQMENLTNCDLKTCVDAALSITRKGKQALFLVRDPTKVTKYIAAAVSRFNAAMAIELAAESLHRVHFHQCKRIDELQCELEYVQQAWKGPDEAKFQLVVVGPLCDLFSGFQTTSGITLTGAGLKRMVELAVNRLRATTGVYVIVIEIEAEVT
ncbi:hypothetical protein Plhal304r1_c078g0165221 [Plasmopara halstedii]